MKTYKMLIKLSGNSVQTKDNFSSIGISKEIFVEY